ncbi:hypothetical protein OGAPHI_006746 [Ogataea philodendri]|uniref:mRNA decay factor PAT1 domain-containing protein n=1 Tax=Ogataea philodendri TaxID=1378263 RepID=A0A9P8T0M5_9ASCO|nr:uncharacterized protein OGAPHI_006746 [Ogataea philodendri]KAH3661339.1 hypothetical protein OGAPHI_006746 [Ogataea philodendri]
MSFFGFDPSGPPSSKSKDRKLETYDFEETYEGLGDQDEDAFNDETFGADTNEIGTNFDFSGGLKQPAQSQAVNPGLSYAKAAQVDQVVGPMASLWNDEAKPASAPSSQPVPEQKVLSLEEIEARLRQPQQQVPPVPQMPQMNPYMFQQQQQLLAAAMASGQFPNPAAAIQALSQGYVPSFQSGMMPFMPFQMQQMMQQGAMSQGFPNQPPQQPPAPQAAAAPQSQPAQPVQSAQPVQQAPSAPVQPEAPASQPAPKEIEKTSSPPQAPASAPAPVSRVTKTDAALSGDFPAFGSDEKPRRPRPQKQSLDSLSKDEKEKLWKRQHKVSAIIRCSGFMNPRDKDFVTRVQLSQIVTDDPYNEDFYCQVYKVLNSSVGEEDMNSIAQKYLDQSGHRLGGREKRADVALQRMQQQVSKAVTVAKERGERTGVLTREGALGKVSVSSGKQPRRQLVINSSEKSDEVVVPKENVYSKSSRAFQLSIIENIYSQILKLESLEREDQSRDSKDLWNALRLSDKIETSNTLVPPFISVLSIDKAMKVFNRLFHFLDSQQQIELIEIIFSNLQNIDVVMKGSYANYVESNYEIPEAEVKKIELFQLTVMKTLVLFVSESNFQQVLRFIAHIVENGSNNILFLTTTKIGLSLITILVSRLELIKQEYAGGLSAQDLAQWQTVYDHLFQALEGRLATIFPPYLSNDDSRKVRNSQSNSDDSYIWQFLASLSLAGQLSHQRIVVDEIRNEIFGSMGVSKALKESGDLQTADKHLTNLNLFLNVMGLKASDSDITEL